MVEFIVTSIICLLCWKLLNKMASLTALYISSVMDEILLQLVEVTNCLTMVNVSIFDLVVNYVKQLQDHMSRLNYGSLATLTGRYYAMDRDKRYERNKVAYDGIVNGVGQAVHPDHVIKVCVVLCSVVVK